MSRKPYPSDISEEECHFVAPYLTLMDANVSQRRHDLREVFNALRWLVRAGALWRLLPHDLPALAGGVPAVPALGRGGLLRGDGQRHALGLRVSDGRRGSRVHMAVDTLGQLIAIRAGARAGQGAVRGGAGGRRRDGQAGVGGSGLHRRAGQAGRPGQRDRPADRQTARGEEGLCPAATTLGGRAQFRLAVALSSAQP